MGGKKTNENTAAKAILARKQETIAKWSHRIFRFIFIKFHWDMIMHHFFHQYLGEFTPAEHRRIGAWKVNAPYIPTETFLLDSVLEFIALGLCILGYAQPAGFLLLADVGGGGNLIHLLYFNGTLEQNFWTTWPSMYWMNLSCVLLMLSDPWSQRPFKQIFLFIICALIVGAAGKYAWLLGMGGFPARTAPMGALGSFIPHTEL